MKKIRIFETGWNGTPIVPMQENVGENYFWIKRDDMIPFSFGGNKARKACEFYRDIKEKNADVIMTYGSNASNHCRVIANMAYAMGLPCHVISPEGHEEPLYNTKLVQQFGAKIEYCPITEVANTIEKRKKEYMQAGKLPYFIMGGGHGKLGTEAYVKVYQEILAYEREENIHFDYIFHASGTGTTQAGLVCGKILNKDYERKIVGISIAREGDRGRQVVRESIHEYLGSRFEELYREDDLVFVDDYRLGGYGESSLDEIKMIQKIMAQEGIPMDATYVGKAYYGMCCYIEEHGIKGKKILFIHTGGTPLFFDSLNDDEYKRGK